MVRQAEFETDLLRGVAARDTLALAEATHADPDGPGKLRSVECFDLTSGK
jgi:hypothetical protein